MTPVGPPPASPTPDEFAAALGWAPGSDGDGPDGPDAWSVPGPRQPDQALGGWGAGITPAGTFGAHRADEVDPPEVPHPADRSVPGRSPLPDLPVVVGPTPGRSTEVPDRAPDALSWPDADASWPAHARPDEPSPPVARAAHARPDEPVPAATAQPALPVEPALFTGPQRLAGSDSSDLGPPAAVAEPDAPADVHPLHAVWAPRHTGATGRHAAVTGLGDPTPTELAPSGPVPTVRAPADPDAPALDQTVVKPAEPADPGSTGSGRRTRGRRAASSHGARRVLRGRAATGSGPLTARSGRRLGNRALALVAVAVIALVVGVTGLVGYGRVHWTASAEHDAGPAPVPAPLPPAPTAPPSATTPAPAAGPARRPVPASPADTVLSQANCTRKVTSAAALNQAVASAAPGQKICAVGSMAGSRLTVSRSGTASAPITVIGSGATPVKGITVEGSNIVVAGFSAVNAQAPGIELTGNNITVRNNTVTHPTGGDFDGLRFFGNNLKILDNTISDITNTDGAHADCMQTYATDSGSPASQNVLIDGNRCQRIDNQCLIAEGPNSSAGDGSGQGRSANIRFTNNFCQAGASQAVWIDDVQNVRLSGNTIQGKIDKAFGIANKSTGAVVSANKLAAGIGFAVGMDSSSRSGYQGPSVGGEP